jgi:hypothetical protein
MSDTTVVPLRQPDEVDDPLTAVLRNGARRFVEGGPISGHLHAMWRAE